MRHVTIVIILACVTLLAGLGQEGCAAPPSGQPESEARPAGPVTLPLGETPDATPGAPFIGDWQGVRLSAGDERAVVVQVIALGGRRYRALVLPEFDKRTPPLVVLEGRESNGRVALEGETQDGAAWTGTMEGERLAGTVRGEEAGTFQMVRVVRLSPTLRAKPPEGAIVLFDGSDLEQWEHPGGRPCAWKLLKSGAMEVVPGTGSVVSKRRFTDHKVHVEFRLPFMPEARGQGRANSGVYLQGRYELQVLDSYGLEGRENECGAVYGIARPRVNMCAPPLLWQTYDIEFRAPRFDEAGRKVGHACMTVFHNGVKVHDQVEVPRPTAGGGGDESAPGPLLFQDHGNPLQCRNIWVVELPPDEPPG